MAPIPLERLIGEVAKRHDLLLSRDDPVLVTVTLNELILAEALAQLQARLEAAQQEIAASSAKQIEASKVIAEQLITASADYVAGEVRAAIIGTGAHGGAKPTETDVLSRRAQSLCWAAAAIAMAAACVSGALAVAALVFMEDAPSPIQCESIGR